MLFRFNHPKPVGDGKAVAVLVSARKVETPSDNHTITLPAGASVAPALPGGALASTAATPAAIRFSVVYGLREYLSFVRQHVTHLVKRRRRALAGQRRTPLAMLERPALLKMLTAVLATPVFLLKRRRAACRIVIDGSGITRVAAAGDKSWAWRDVRDVRAYTRGYLLFLPTGAIPIPYRCLDDGQRVQLRTLVGDQRRRRADLS